jgi:hypothetical protein
MSDQEYKKKPSKKMVLSIINKAITYTNQKSPTGFAHFRQRRDGSIIMTSGPLGTFIPCASTARCLTRNEVLEDVMIDIYDKTNPANPIYMVRYKDLPIAALVDTPDFVEMLSEEEKVFYAYFMKLLRDMFIDDKEGGTPFYLFHDFIFDALYYTNSVPYSRDRITWKNDLENVMYYNRNAEPSASLMRRSSGK